MPQSAKPLEIAIIGAGFSGTMTAYHLIKETAIPLTINLINPKETFGKGPAYSAASHKHLLNVPAGKMSAIAEDPEHFLHWAHLQPAYQSVDKSTLGKVFLPRQLYGKYIHSLWAEAIANKREDTTVNVIYDSAVDIVQEGGKYKVHLTAQAPISADYVILATGNETPANPPIPNAAFYTSASYIKNPWLTDVTKLIKAGQNILIIGNGLTTVDLILTIMDTGYKGQIHTLSPSGFAILPHRQGHLEYKDFVNELKEPYKLDEIHETARKHYRRLHKVGISIEPIIDSLRPLTQKIWKALSEQDKQAFLRDIKSRWNQVRHRLAPQLYDYVQRLRLAGSLIVHTARLIDIKEDAQGIHVQYLNKKTGNQETLSVGLVINCTGPHTDISRSEDPLLQALVAKGMIVPDSQRIGMDVTDSWVVKTSEGKENKGLYTIGGNLRGLLWETTAVPELKNQTAQLAKKILLLGT
jgi:uncharacterized NAD(P)/FAD-binding protein YdhS